MKRLKDRITSGIRRFLRRTDGLMVTEFVLVLPIFIFCTISIYSYWDAWRSLNSSQKATYTVSDMIARTMQPIDEPFLAGLRNTMQYMVGDKLPVKMRVSSVMWSGVRNRYEVQWSRSPNSAMPQLTTTTLQLLKSKIPVLSDGDTVVIVETNTNFTPIFGKNTRMALYLDQQDFQQFIVTRPRFVPQVCMVGVACN